MTINDDNSTSNSGSGSAYQVDDDLSDGFAAHKETPLQFKISMRSDEEILTNVFQRSLAEQVQREMERQYSSGATEIETVATALVPPP